MRDHGGDLDRARARHGGPVGDWVDLSTGINRIPYPLPDLPGPVWQALPDRDLHEQAIAAARDRYGATHSVLPVAGAQAAIQLLPRSRVVTTVHIVTPTYNEHAASFAAAGWQVMDCADVDAIPNGAIAVVVNPNNPDGRCWDRPAMLALAERCDTLIVDESFADATPDLSVADQAGRDGLIVLRSLGKFYGLAGLRLGFVLGGAELAVLEQLAGPWAVSGPALAVGAAALSDHRWAEATRARLAADTARLDALAAQKGWPLVGGTPLFRLYDTGDAEASQNALARHHIWTRRFPYSQSWLRLGLPGPAPEWERLEAAFSAPD